MLTDFHKLQRFIWCKKNENTDFSNYLFVDESAVRLIDIPKFHVRLKNSRPETFPVTSKIRLKINVWGGISSKGPTPFIVCTNKFCFY